MTAIDNTPSNKNFLSPLNFKFTIKKAPHVNFFIQKVNIPMISLRQVDIPSPLVRMPIPGDHIDYANLNVTFKVDEDLQNYLEIHNWIKSLGKPEDSDQYYQIQQKDSWTGEGIYSDISVMVLSSTKMANYEIVYTDAHPVSLSGLNFTTTDTDVNYVEATATFKYTLYNINKVQYNTTLFINEVTYETRRNSRTVGSRFQS